MGAKVHQSIRQSQRGTATWIRPAWTRRAGLAGQGFALLGTLVGIFTIAVGVGPRTVPDIVYHILIVGVLLWGLVVTKREAVTA